MIAEEFGIANISAERVHALVAAHVHHFEDRGAAPRGRCQEAGAERMAGEEFRINNAGSSRRSPATTRTQLAAWVRSIGVTDPELAPNHAWRHTFKAIGARCGISEKLLDAIVGHAPASVGRAYGEPMLADKAAALANFPRYRP
jgi:integrase